MVSSGEYLLAAYLCKHIYKTIKFYCEALSTIVFCGENRHQAFRATTGNQYKSQNSFHKIAIVFRMSSSSVLSYRRLAINYRQGIIHPVQTTQQSVFVSFIKFRLHEERHLSLLRPFSHLTVMNANDGYLMLLGQERFYCEK